MEEPTHFLGYHFHGTQQSKHTKILSTFPQVTLPAPFLSPFCEKVEGLYSHILCALLAVPAKPVCTQSIVSQDKKSRLYNASFSKLLYYFSLSPSLSLVLFFTWFPSKFPFEKLQYCLIRIRGNRICLYLSCCRASLGGQKSLEARCVGAAAASTAGDAGKGWSCADFFWWGDDGLRYWNDRLLAKDPMTLTREECGCLETCQSDQDDFNWK